MTDANPPRATGLSRIQEISELIKRLCLALANVEMYTADHPLAMKTIGQAYEWLAAMLQRENRPVVLSASGKRILLDLMPLEDKNPLVSKFASRMDELHIDNLVFTPGLTIEELRVFYGLIGKGPRYVNEHGGLAALLSQAQLTHVTLQEISYVMVTPDQKVVSRDAKVVEGEAAGAFSSNEEIVRYLVGRILRRVDDQKWLINEMKNSPARIAEIFTEGINLAASRAEMGMADDASSVESLIQNIQIVGQSLIDQQTGEVREGEQDLEKAVLTLETELRTRGARLMSSKVATGFVNEILGVVASYADRVRAKKISDQFLKGERSLKATEAMLRNLMPTGASPDRFVVQIQDLLKKRGMTDDDLGKLLSGLRRKEKPPKPSKPRKPYSQAVFDGVSKRLKDLNVQGERLQEVVDSLSSFIEERAREKAGEMRTHPQPLQSQVERRNAALHQLPIGILLWDHAGKVDLVNPVATGMLGTPAGVDLSEALRGILAASRFPLTDPDAHLRTPGLSDAETRLLMAVSLVLKDDKDEIFGVLLQKR